MKRFVILVHRWLGVALSLLFLLWFLSGIVMMYWSFPEITPQDRLRRLPALDPARIALSASEAAARLAAGPRPSSVRLTTVDGRPAYRFGGVAARGAAASRREAATVVVYADDGATQTVVDAAAMDRAAARWAGRRIEEAAKESLDEVDQWTVGALRNVRPLFKYSWPDGQQVYVEARSGEVVQYTTSASRLWAYLGAIPHWLYFTPLRKHPEAWTSVVIWSSSLGTITAVLGIVVLLWTLSPRKRYRYKGGPAAIPYHGWKRWHAIAGLCFGLVTVTWAFSGLLSMGPFSWMQRLTAIAVPAEARDGSGRRGGDGAPPMDIAGALRGREPDLSAFDGRHPRAAVERLAAFGSKELELVTFDGRPFYLARNGDGDTRIVPADGDPATAFDAAEIMRVVRRAVEGQLAELRVMTEYDAYYLDRRGRRPLPVVYARLNDPAGTRYYIDVSTATVAGTYTAREWGSRWLYHGLHSLDFPWLYRYRPLWDIVVITLLVGGAALSATSIVLAWGVIGRLRLRDRGAVAEGSGRLR